MLRAQTHRKMQIGLGVLLLAAVLLTLVAAAWPLMTAHAQGATPGNHITPKWTQCGYAYICYTFTYCNDLHPERMWVDDLCYTDGVGWHWELVCMECPG